VGDIQYFVMKQEQNKEWLIYCVLYRNRGEIDRVLYTLLFTETGLK